MSAENQRVNVLLVDDQPSGLLALESTLSPLGVNLVTASSGREALRHLLRTEFAVILLDVVMPDLDGFETAQLIRERRSAQTVPIIFLTGLSHGEVPQFRAYSLGAVDYVLKPVHPEILRSKVSVFVELAVKRQQIEESNTQLRAANKRIVEQQMQVIQCEKLASVGLLAAGVAHEINNPLMGVKNCVELLKDPRASHERRKVYFDAISGALDHIGETVQSLLGYAREQPLEFTTVDMSGVVSTCLPLIAPVLQTRKVEVRQLLSPGDAIVRGSAGQLGQATMNVLLNAAQASPPGSQVEVTCQADGDRVAVRFEDHGVGIPHERLSRVCDPFFTTKPQGQGTGLGLSVTQGILHAHGGELAIASQEGQGTVVTFWLPRAAVQQVALAT